MSVLRKLAAAAAAATVLSPLGAATTASAETTPSESTEVDPDQFCVYDVNTRAAQCSPDEVVADGLARRDAGALVKVWGKPNYKGKWMVLHAGSPAKELCEGGDLVGKISDLRDFYKGLPRGQNWNNRISSLKPLHGCAVSLFGRKNLQGQNTDWLPRNVPRLGKLPTGWNNAATSMLFG